MTEGEHDKIKEIILDTAYQVAQSIKEENSGFAPHIINELKKINAWQVKHQLEDTEVHTKILQFMDDCQPMLAVFKDNRVAEAVIEKKTKKITFYIKEATTVGVFLLGVWGIIKFLLNK